MNSKKIAIVGCGPRGLAALEFLVLELAQKQDENRIEIHLFDPCVHPGAGAIWNPDQSTSNWLNIADRALQELKRRPAVKFQNVDIPSFKSYSEWVEHELGVVVEETIDKFPPRAQMGQYLSARFQSIYAILSENNYCQLHRTAIESIAFRAHSFSLLSSDHKTYSAHECLISVGHQPTQDSEQIAEWKAHTENSNGVLFTDSYDERIYPEIKSSHTIGLRGFGLGMIDVARMLTLDKGASFSDLDLKKGDVTYNPSHDSIKKIIPYSLDGLPPMPKPLNAIVDRLFEPSASHNELFSQKLNSGLAKAAHINSARFVTEAFAEIVADLFTTNRDKVASHTLSYPELREVIIKWCEDPDYSHALFLDRDQPTIDYMKKSVAIALGNAKPTLDYFCGQVWRQLQPSFYSIFSHSDLKDDVLDKIVDFDERTKRFSYGPPVESILQIIALTEAGVFDLSFVADPNIACTDQGWKLSKNEDHINVDVMIDTVLEAPKLIDINSPIFDNLLNDDLLSPVTSDLGVKTNRDGTVVLSKEKEDLYLTMNGRNTKGSKIGVDAILECFGPSIQDWARGVSERI